MIAAVLASCVAIGFMVWAIVHTNGRIGWYEDERDGEVFIRELCGALDDDLTAALDDIERQVRARARELEAQHVGMLLRRVAWLRRRVDARPGGPSFDRRELAALEWALDIVRVYSPKPEPRLAFADDIVSVAMLDGPL